MYISLLRMTDAMISQNPGVAERLTASQELDYDATDSASVSYSAAFFYFAECN
jgi:hypothetical protein